MLRVEVARPDFKLRLEKEWEADTAAEAEAASGAAAEGPEEEADDEAPAPLDPNRPFYLPMPGRKRRVRTYGLCCIWQGKDQWPMLHMAASGQKNNNKWQQEKGASKWRQPESMLARVLPVRKR